MGRCVAFVINARAGDELSGGRQDATRIYSLLTRSDLGQCDPRLSRLLVDCESRRALEEGLLQTLTFWDSFDQLIFYYSGHGEVRNERYVLLFGEGQKSVLPFDNLMADLGIHGVARAILMLDSCHSGAILKGQKSAAPVPLATHHEV